MSAPLSSYVVRATLSHEKQVRVCTLSPTCSVWGVTTDLGGTMSRHPILVRSTKKVTLCVIKSCLLGSHS